MSIIAVARDAHLAKENKMRSKYNLTKLSFVVILLIFFSLVGGTGYLHVSELKQEIALAKIEIIKLKLQSIKSISNTALLKPGSEGYSVVKFDLGVLTISIANVRPYANGAKVTLRFGNILSCAITGLKAKIEYGRVDEEGNPVNNEVKSKEVTFDEPLKSSSWTNVNVVLDGIPSEQLGFLRVRDVSHVGISLSKQ